MEKTFATMKNKVCLVTGATSGLGQATALKLARLGAHVIVVGRSRARIENTLALLRSEQGANGYASVDSIRADLSSMDEVRRTAAEVMKRCDRLDVLMNNVGATLTKRRVSPDGYEMTWALNYLSHFLLTYELLGLLKATAASAGEARVIETTSSMCRYADPRFKDVQGDGFYNGVLAYARSKLANVMFAAELARRLAGTGITANAITPGFVRTDISQNSHGLYRWAFDVVNRVSMDVNEGVEPMVWMAASPEVSGVTGKYYYRFKQMGENPAWNDPENVARLWRISEQMTGLAPV